MRESCRSEHPEVPMHVLKQTRGTHAATVSRSRHRALRGCAALGVSLLTAVFAIVGNAVQAVVAEHARLRGNCNGQDHRTLREKRAQSFTKISERYSQSLIEVDLGIDDLDQRR